MAREQLDLLTWGLSGLVYRRFIHEGCEWEASAGGWVPFESTDVWVDGKTIAAVTRLTGDIWVATKYPDDGGLDWTCRFDAPDILAATDLLLAALI